MKKTTLLYCLLFFFYALFCRGCEKAPVIESITLDKTELSLAVGVNYTLIPTVLSANAANPTVKWTSSKTSVATVDANGKVIAVAVGTATIIAKAGDKAAQCAVTVTKDNIEMVFVRGGTFTMGATSEQGSDSWDDERPVHQVTLSDFYIGKYELTQAQ